MSANKNIAVQGTTFSNLNSSKTIGLVTFGTTAGLTGYDNATVIPDLNQGVLGESNNGYGVTGITQSKDPNGAVGVAGYDLSPNNPNNIGVVGFSATNVGVYGSGHTTNGIGVYGNAKDGGIGVYAQSHTNNGVAVFGNAFDGGVGLQGRALTSSGVGVLGTSPDGGIGVFGRSKTATGTAIEGVEPDGGIAIIGNSPGSTPGLNPIMGVWGDAANGWGVYGHSNTRVGVVGSGFNIGVAAINSNSAVETISVQNFGGGPLIKAFNSSKEVLSLDNAGNMVLAGSLTQFGTPMTAARTVQGQNVVMYSPKQSVATVEDVGEGQLSGGQALVRIESTFATTMDNSRAYLV
ncbi:MAG: hypothetical protein M3007_06680, partial [Candidatus Eremiobacteraeota bacterium]|nr:hypothetical protein [Candidatus Eremiobacteraeota bacterium]